MIVITVAWSTEYKMQYNHLRKKLTKFYMDIILNKCRKKTLDYQYWYGCRLILKGLKTAIFIVRTLKVFTNSASKFKHHMSPIYWSISLVLDNVCGGGRICTIPDTMLGNCFQHPKPPKTTVTLIWIDCFPCV